jgi:formylglycine-generating enzyme required for sulfatase activity
MHAMIQLLERRRAFLTLPIALAVLALVGAGCESAKTAPTGQAALQPSKLLPHAGSEDGSRDLTPVTWMELPVHPPVEIVREGKATAVIYVADPKGRGHFDPYVYRHMHAAFPPVLVRLVNELVEVVRLGSGAELERVDQPPSADQPAIVIGDCEETRRAGIDAAKIPVEGFVVKTGPNRVYLVGSTQALPPGVSGANDGTAWAVADFLERFVGVRWYWPAEYGGRSILRQDSLVITPAHYRDQPVFRLRTLHPDETPLLPLSFSPHAARPVDQRILPFTSGVLPDGETAVTAVPQRALWRIGVSLPYQTVQQGAKHADVAGSVSAGQTNGALFALRKDGTRDRHVFCYSAPETLAFALQSCERVWEKGANVGAWITPTSVNIWFPSTPGLACHCPVCRETAARFREDRELTAGFAARHGDRRAFEMVEQLAHERVISLFVKRLSEEVAKRWPDKKVIFYPWDTNCSEGIGFPSNLVVHAFNMSYSMGLMHQPVVRRAQTARLRVWSGPEEDATSPKGSGAAGARPVNTWFGSYGPSDWTYGPVQYPHVVRDFYRSNREFIGGSSVLTYSAPCWTTLAPTFYVWMRVLWNPELDVEATLDEMCRRLFGPGAASARALLRLECERWEGATWTQPLTENDMTNLGENSLRFSRDLHFRESWPQDVVVRMKALRDQALAEMSGDSNARQSFLYWTWTFDEFLKEADAIHRNAGRTVDASSTQKEASPPPVPIAPQVAAKANISAQQTPSASSETRTNAQDGAEMALIPAGTFRMGTSDQERDAWHAAHPGDRGSLFKFTDEQPGRRVYLDAYYMYKTEVTVAQYRKFCKATGRAMPPAPALMVLPSGWTWQDTHPIVNVSWDDAKAYAEWAGAALPTEAQWEKAARGGDRRLFQWGDAWPPPQGAGNFADQTCSACGKFSRAFLSTANGQDAIKFTTFIADYTDGFALTAPVGGDLANPFGLHDMAGNVREWCADWYDAGYYRTGPTRNPIGPAAGVWRVVRGGSWHDSTPSGIRAACRGDYQHLPVGAPSCIVGFRCVVRAP